jgi:hypothetical protein
MQYFAKVCYAIANMTYCHFDDNEVSVQAAYTELLLIQSCIHWLVLCLLIVTCLLVSVRLFARAYTFSDVEHLANMALSADAGVSTHMWRSLRYALLAESTATLECHGLRDIECSHARCIIVT